MFQGRDLPIRDFLHVAAALAVCCAVAWLDIQTNSDITEAFLVPLAFIFIYPLKRDWATVLTALGGIAAVVAGALLEPDGETMDAMVINRGMTIIVILGIAFLLNRVTHSEKLLVRIATTDPLTGIFNRRHFMSMLAREHHRAERYKTTFSLLMLDIDHFKRINDTYGHPVGDEAIKAMAGAASKHLRPTDLIGRFGGEEFVVLLPHTEEGGAVVAAERIRESVGKVVVNAGDKEVRFTVSIGAATYTRRVSAEALLNCADQALYAAKTGGRNQVCVGRLAEPDNGNGASTLAPA
jgi:diguanylate cyclase (GGDEF)-like protein